MEIPSFLSTRITLSSVYHLQPVNLTFKAPHSSTVSASSTTVIRKFGVCRSSLKRKPFSKFLQPVEKEKQKLKKKNNLFVRYLAFPVQAKMPKSRDKVILSQS